MNQLKSINLNKFNNKIGDTLKFMSEWKTIQFPPLEFIKTNTDFDKPNGGLLKGGLTVLCGASGDGKSMSALHIAAKLSKNYTILYISAENDIRIDLERWDEIKQIYEVDDDRILYLNILHSELNSTELKLSSTDFIESLIADGYIDVVVLDAWQNITNASEGSKMYAEGNDICAKLCKLATKYNTAFLMTWQLKNGNKGKSIDTITIDDISVSVGIARYATSVWCVKRTLSFTNKSGEKCPETWKMALLKSRVNWNTEHTIIDVLDNEGKFNLNGKNLLSYEEAEKLLKELEENIDLEK